MREIDWHLKTVLLDMEITRSLDHPKSELKVNICFISFILKFFNLF